MEKVIIEKVIFSLNMFLGRDIDKKIKREIAELAASKIMEAFDKGECIDRRRRALDV